MKKIMFNDRFGLTQAVLDGRKTMTRRVVLDGNIRFAESEAKISGTSLEESLIQNSYYLPYENIAIAQSYESICPNDDPCYDWMRLERGWTNKMFINARFMPHHIRVTNIRVERLQDISDEDCLREGIKVVNHPSNINDVYYAFQHQDSALPYRTARTAFAKLIDKVSGDGTWKSNPWVYVYEFELVD